MANQIRYQVGFNVNKSDLNQIKSSLQQIQKVKLEDVMKINKTDMNSARDALKSIQEDASKVENALNKAFNTKLNTLNIDKFNKQLSSSNLTIQKVYQSFSRAGTVGQSAFNNLSTQILNTNVQLRQSNKLLDSMATSMANTVKWGITSSVFNNMTRSIQQAYYYAKDLDRSLTNIRIVTGDSADQMERFATTANSAAKELGRSTLDYTKASLTFYQQGLDDQQVAARTEATLKAQNITGIGTEMADYLTAVWNGFNVGAEEAEQYVDKLAAVADSTASDMGQLATAMSKVASAANSIGVDMDQLNGQIATVIATTRQAPESVGAAFKTIYARINDIQAGTEDAEVSLGNYSGKMAELGFNVLDATGHLRDTGQVIEEIGGRWESLTKEQQINLAQTMAGQRQYNNLIALFDNWDKYLQSVNTSMNAQGTLNEKNDRYLESLEAHMQQLGTQAERTYDILFDENSVKGWVDALDGALGIFNDFISGLGGGTTAFTYFGSLIAGIFNKQIAQAIQGVGVEINRFKANLGSIAAKQQIIDNIKSNIQASYAGEGKNIGDVALKAQAEAAQKTLAVQKGLTIEQQKQAVQIQKQIGLSQQKITDLENEKQIRQQEIQKARDLTGIETSNIYVLKQRKTEQQEIVNELTKNLSIYDRIEMAAQEIAQQQQNRSNLTKRQKEQLEEQKNAAVNLANEYRGAFQKMYEAQHGNLKGFQAYWNNTIGLIKQGKFELTSWQNLEQYLTGQQRQQVQKLNSIDYLIKNIGIDTSKLTEEEKKKLAALIQQNKQLAEQGQKTLNLQTLIKGMSAAGQVLSSWAGAAKVFGDQMATAQQKANATISSIQGTISGVGTMFGPIGMGIATLANGAISLIKEITPIGDLIEGLFESTRDKVDEFNQSLSEIGKQEQSTNQKIGSLQTIAQEYETLSNKVQAYGGSLNALTEEQKNRYHELTDEFAQYNESIIVGYDNQGHAIIKNQQGIKQTIQLLRDQQRESARTKLGDTGQALQIKNSELGLSIEEATTAKETAITGKETFESLLKNYQNILNDDIVLLQEELNNSGQLFEQQALIPFLKTVTGQNLDLSFLQNSDNLKNVNDYLLALQKAILDDPEILKDQNVLKVYQTFFKELSEVDQIASSSSSLPGINNFISNFVQSSQQTKKAIETAQSNLTAAQQSMKSGQVKFDSSFIMQMLQYGEGYSDQFEQLESLDLYDQDIYDTIVDALSGWTFTENLERDVENKTAHSYQQILEFGRVYIQNLVTTLSELGTEINTAKQKSAKDLEKIANGKDKTSKELIEAITKSIQSNWLNDPAILEALKDPGQKTSIINLIKNLYGLENFVVDQNGVIQQVETAATQAASEIKAALVKGLFEGVSAESLFSGEVPQIPEEDLGKFLDQFGAEQIIALNKAFKQKQPEIKGLDDFKVWALDYFKELDEVQLSNNLAENFDKVISIIQKLQNGKDLSYKEKLNLMNYLGLDPQQVQNTEDILDAFKKQIESLTDPLQRFTALSQIFDSFESLQEHAKDFGLKETSEQYQALWQNIFDTKLNQLGIEDGIQGLKRFTEARNQAFDFSTLEGKKAALDFAKQTINLDKLTESIQKNGQAIKESGTKTSAGIKMVQDLQDAFSALGVEVSLDWLVQNIDKVIEVAKDGIVTLEELQALSEGKVKSSSTSKEDKYQKSKQQTANLSSASSTLADNGKLSDDQAKAIAQIESKNEQLAKLAEDQSRYSQDYLDKLNEIIAAQQVLNEKKREGALEEAQAELERLQGLQQMGEISEQTYQRAQTILENRQGHDDRDVAYAEKVVEAYQKRNTLEEDIANTQAKIIQLEQVDLETVKDKYHTFEELYSALANEEITQDQFDALRPEILEEEIEALGRTKEQFEDFVNVLKQSSKDLAQNQEQAEDMAITQWEMQEALDNLVDKFDDYAEAINNAKDLTQDAKLADTDYINAISSLKTAMQGLLGVELSNKFLSDAHNLELMKAAIEGNIDALQQLRAAAAQDVLINLDLDQESFNYISSLVNDYIANTNFDDLEIGAALDDTNFIAALNSMILNGQTTAEEVSKLLSAIGYEAQVGTDHASVPISVPSIDWSNQIESITSGSGLGGAPTSVATQMKQQMGLSMQTVNADFTVPYIKGANYKGNKSAANRITSHPSAPKTSSNSGSGKPKGSTKKPKANKEKEDTSTKDLKDNLEDQRDIYHDINIQIKQINRNLDRVQKQQDRLYGKELVNNLNKQQQLLEKQKKTLAEKLQLQKQDLKNQQNKLRSLGVEFDQDNKIANYMDALLNKQQEVNAATAQYNDLVNAYNSTTNKEIKESLAKQIEASEDLVNELTDEYNKLEKGIKDYDKLREDMEDLVDDVEELTQQQIEIEIKKFRMKVEIHLEMGEAEREWNEFRRNVIERPDYMKSTNFNDILAGATQNKRDISSYFNLNNSGTGTIETLTNQLLNTKKAIEDIDKTGTSAIYGDNKELAMQHLQKDLKELMSQLENYKDLIDEIDKAYLDTIDDVQKNFDKQIEDYQFVGDLIDHDIDLLTILYGDKNYDAMDKYYTTLEQNNNKELDSLRKQADWWKKQWDAARNAGDTKAAEKFEAAYKKTIKSLNSQIEESAKIIRQKYENTINKIFDDLDKKISGGKGTDYLSMEWELMNKNEEQYLDTINSAFAIQETQRKYNRALNETKSIKNQQALKKLMDEQLGILKNKNKLTQYDIDRAEKLLQIEQARIALEQTRSSKTSMRLKRDSQGNYSYQYMADQGAIGDAEENLAKAQNDLYNFDKEAYKQNLEDMLSAWKDYLSKRKEILLDNNLKQAQQKEKLALLDEQYGEYINGKTEQNLAIRNNLTESAFKDIAAIYDTDVDNYKKMTDAQKDILMTSLIPAWDGGVQHMATTFAEQGGFIPTCQAAFGRLDIATKDYETSLDTMATNAGIDLGDVKSGTDEVAEAFRGLITENGELITTMDQQMTAIGQVRDEAQNLVNDYEDVADAAIAAVTQIQSLMQNQEAEAATAADTAAVIEDSYKRISKAQTAAAKKASKNKKTYNNNNDNSSDNSNNNYSGDNGYTPSAPAIVSNSTSAKKKSSGTPYSPPYKTTVTSIPGRGTVTHTRTGPGTRRIIKRTGKKFDTGGYTGDWNSNEGRLAVLHQKELVLNKTDTENFLSSVAILREINSSLNGNMFSMLNGLYSNKGFDAYGDTLEQNVHIDANFPNVNSKKEIEEAFNELVNMAAQRAMRR